ncbi:MAG: hypothetical protein AB9907_12135 [Flexilinea sp.]
MFIISGQKEVTAKTVILIGENENYQTLEEAIEKLPDNCGDTFLQLSENVHGDPVISLSIPLNKGITSLTIEGIDPDAVISIETIGEIYANGISFTLGENISFPNAWIFGGMLAENGKMRSVEESRITILGSSAYAFGGGAAYNGGRSVIKGNTTVVLGKNGRIFWEIFGGGYASGSESIAEVGTTNVKIFGKADYVLGGGLAREKGRSIVKEISNVIIESVGNASIALFGGGNAVGQGSFSETKWASSVIHGSAAWAFGGDFTYQGGQSQITGTAEITVSESGKVESLYGGSFATDENSRSEVNRTLVNVFGTAGSITPEGETSYGGISTVTNATGQE